MKITKFKLSCGFFENYANCAKCKHPSKRTDLLAWTIFSRVVPRYSDEAGVHRLSCSEQFLTPLLGDY